MFNVSDYFTGKSCWRGRISCYERFDVNLEQLKAKKSIQISKEQKWPKCLSRQPSATFPESIKMVKRCGAPKIGGRRACVLKRSAMLRQGSQVSWHSFRAPCSRSFIYIFFFRSSLGGSTILGIPASIPLFLFHFPPRVFFVVDQVDFGPHLLHFHGEVRCGFPSLVNIGWTLCNFGRISYFMMYIFLLWVSIWILCL